MPWIHVDLCAIYLEAIENVAVNGAYNAALQMILQIQASRIPWLPFMDIRFGF
jgi:hypothetical protein